MNPKNCSTTFAMAGSGPSAKRFVCSVVLASCRAFLLLLLCFIPSLSAQLVRRANTTLTLPLEPVAANGQIVLTEAFPGITFEFPDCIRSLPGDTNKLFVVERYGRIMVIDDLANPQPRLFMDISDRVFAT